MTAHEIRAGMVGVGMIFDETYRPLFEALQRDGLYRRDFGSVEVGLTAVASRTGGRAENFRAVLGNFASFHGPTALPQLLAGGVDVVCIATPDDRHFEPARAALAAGKHELEVTALPYCILVDPNGVVRFEGNPTSLNADKLRHFLAKYSQ